MLQAKRILIFNVNWLGDVLFSTATIRTVRENYPESFIACCIPSRCYQVLEGNPHIDEIIVFDERQSHRSLKNKLSFIRFLKRRQFDMAILLHRSLSRTLICRLAGIPSRLGYYTRKRGFLLTHKVASPGSHTLHRIDYYLRIIEGAGFKVNSRRLDFHVSKRDIHFVDDFLSRQCVEPGDKLVALNPGGNWLPKRWPKEHWARLADRIIAELGYKVVFTGGQKDKELFEGIRSIMQQAPLEACGVLSIKQLGALARRADMFVTADSGPLHIAVAAGARKICALFGPTSSDLTGPYPKENAVIFQKNVGCAVPCYVRHCKDYRCMKAITPDEVFEEIKKQLG